MIKKNLLGRSDKNKEFSELCKLLRNQGFEERIRGSHHIFSKENIEEIVNIQLKGKTAKSYQVKQIRNILLKYKIGEIDE